MELVTTYIPVAIAADTAAEEWLAGCAVAVRGVAERLLASMVAEHFYRPGCWRAIHGAVGLDGDIEQDITTVATFAGLEPAEVRRWVESRPVHADTGGGLERRVRVAAERRWRMYDLVEQLEVA